MINASPPNILVVDDNRANRKLACEFLKHLDVVAESAESGYEAIEKCQDTHFDLILMDIQMPGLNGFETTAQIRSHERQGRRVPIVALTAEPVDDQKIKLLLADMDDFLNKPLSEDDLKSTIDRWIHSPLFSSAKDELNLPNTPTIEPANADTPSLEVPAYTNKAVIFNLSESLRLSKQLPDLAMDMLNFLINSLGETKQWITQAAADNDSKTLLEVTHKFHGGCCYCGVPSLKDAVKNLETHLAKEDKSDIPELVTAVVNEMDRLQAWADEHDIEALFQEC